MKNKMRVAISLMLCLVVWSCSNESYDPDDHLTPKEKDAIVQTIVRYAAKAPESISFKERFSAKYDTFYLEKASEIRFEQYIPKKDYFYFLITQPAPSLVEKRHATGGRFKLSDKGELTEYEEIFRTWKMVPDTLRRRSHLLFDRMVKGEDLTKYYTANSKVEYIEFPDDHVYFDVAGRQWKVKE